MMSAIFFFLDFVIIWLSFAGFVSAASIHTRTLHHYSDASSHRAESCTTDNRSSHGIRSLLR